MGAVAGAAATALMSGVMLAAQRAGLMGELPPSKITNAAVDAVGAERVDRPTRNALSAGAHFGFGVFAGAAFGILHRRIEVGVPVPVQGIVFGTVVWLVSYAGWVPALGIMPPPHRDRPGRQPSMLVSHWVYGGVLGAVVSVLSRR